jgi:hypothetical protein
LRIPDEIIDMVKDDSMMNRNKNRMDNKLRQGGRGRGGPARG